jgi:hypothetical protein
VSHPTLDGLRKRILLFYFAGGVNLFMAVYVMSAGAGTVEPGKLTTIAVIFIVFALINFYVARKLRTQWSRLTRQTQSQVKPDSAASDG